MLNGHSVCLSEGLTAVDTMTKATLIRTTFNWAGLQVQRFSPLSSKWEHGSAQAGMAQDKFSVLHVVLEANRRRLSPT